MDEAAIIQYVKDAFADIYVAAAEAASFFYYSPEGEMPERTFPFATLVAKDDYDRVSNLNRPGVFRLNIGVSKQTFLSLFGSLPSPPGADGVIDTGHDFAALDQLMPHPVYGHLFWVCVLNPGDATFQTVRTLLAEAYGTAVSKHAKRAPAEKS
jgi:hypothetical protein